MDDRSDAELIRRANLGSESAMQSLYLRYKDWVYSRALRLCRNQEDACDVLQETFLYLFRKFPGFELTCTMKTFLFPVVKNNSLQCIRRRKRSAEITEQLSESTGASTQPPSTVLPDIQRHINALPEKQKEALLMRFFDDMQLSEISECLNIPLGTVKSRLHNALSSVRKSIKS